MNHNQQNQRMNDRNQTNMGEDGQKDTRQAASNVTRREKDGRDGNTADNSRSGNASPESQGKARN